MFLHRRTLNLEFAADALAYMRLNIHAFMHIAVQRCFFPASITRLFFLLMKHQSLSYRLPLRVVRLTLHPSLACHLESCERQDGGHQMN